MTDNNEINCIYCYESINSSSKVCPKCGKFQTNFHFYMDKFYLKEIIGLLFIPLAIWVISTKYIENSHEATNLSSQNKDIINIIQHLKSYSLLIYNPCIRNNPKECINNAEKYYMEYIKSFNKLKSLVILHYPELTPSIELLKNLNISQNTFNIWNNYSICIENQKNNKEFCMNQKNRKANFSLEVSDFIIEYIFYKIQQKVSKDIDKNISDYAKKIIKIRENICLIEPKKELDKHNGWRISENINGEKKLRHIDMKRIHRIIFNQYIVPGSGLGGKWDYKNISIVDENEELKRILQSTGNLK